MKKLLEQTGQHPLPTPAASPAVPDDPPRRGRRLIDPFDLLKRFVLGVIGSCIFSAFMFFVQIKTFVVIVMAAVLTFFGWKTEPPKEVKEAGAQVLNSIKVEASEHVPPALRGGVLPQLHESDAAIRARAEREEAARQRELEHDRAEADALGIAWDAGWGHEKFEVEISIARQARAEAERKAEESARRAELIARATKVNFGVNADLDVEEMERQVREAERYVNANAEYQLEHRQWEQAMVDYRHMLATSPNANCPSCRFPMRLPTSNTTRQAMCSRCKFVTSRRVMLAQHRDPPPPKEPPSPRTNPGILGRFFK